MTELPGPGDDLAVWSAAQWARVLPDVSSDAAALAVRLDLMKDAFDRSRERALRPWNTHGIRSIDDFQTVSFLRHLGQAGVRIHHLAGFLQAESGTLSRRLARLADAGTVERFDDPSDRRAQRVRLTEGTAPMIDEIHRALLTNHDEFFEKLRPDEQQTLSELLAKLQR